MPTEVDGGLMRGETSYLPDSTKDRGLCIPKALYGGT